MSQRQGQRGGVPGLGPKRVEGGNEGGGGRMVSASSSVLASQPSNPKRETKDGKQDMELVASNNGGDKNDPSSSSSTSNNRGGKDGNATSTSDRQERPEKEEIYTYEAPWLVYGMNWSVREDKKFRLAIGSFVEEYNNKVSEQPKGELPNIAFASALYSSMIASQESGWRS